MSSKQKELFWRFAAMDDIQIAKELVSLHKNVIALEKELKKYA